MVPQEARGRLSSAQASVQQLRRQLADAELGRKDLELRNQALQGERDAAQRERETGQRERDRLKLERDALARYHPFGLDRSLSSCCSLKLCFAGVKGYKKTKVPLSYVSVPHLLPYIQLVVVYMCVSTSGKGNLELVAQAAQSSTHMLQMDYEKLQLSVTSAQRERDHEREEREAALQERDRAKADTHRMYVSSWKTL